MMKFTAAIVPIWRPVGMLAALILSAEVPLEESQAQSSAEPHAQFRSDASSPEVEGTSQSGILGEYLILKAGLNIAQLCRQLPPEQVARLGWYTRQVAARAVQETSIDQVAGTRQVAASISEQKPCSPETKELAEELLPFAEDIAKRIGIDSYRAATSWQDDRKVITKLVKAQIIDNRCHLLDVKSRQELDGLRDAATLQLREFAGTEVSDDIVMQALAEAHKSSNVCSDDQKRMIEAAFDAGKQWVKR